MRGLCEDAGLVPLLLNRSNQPLYYAAMEHAMVHGRHAPLLRLLHLAAKDTLHARWWDKVVISISLWQLHLEDRHASVCHHLLFCPDGGDGSGSSSYPTYCSASVP